MLPSTESANDTDTGEGTTQETNILEEHEVIDSDDEEDDNEMDVDDESEDKISVEGDESEGEENDEVY